jgi:hypothetical protein
MKLQRRDLLLFASLATAASTPVFGQALELTVAVANSGKESTASILDFSGKWAHPFLNGLEFIGRQGLSDPAQPMLARAGAICFYQLWNARSGNIIGDSPDEPRI